MFFLVQLRVPLFKQEKGSVDCGIVSIEMILKYYGFDVSFSSLKKEISVDEVGTYMPQLGSYLLRNGFDVSIVSFHPGLFTSKHRSLSGVALKNHFQELFSFYNNPQHKKVLSYFIDFIDLGGKVIVDIPSKIIVKNELLAGRPVGTILTSNFLLMTDKPRFNFHFNVITGMTDETITVNDPAWGAYGGEHTYDIDDFFYGVYASAFGDLDNASLLLVKKK